MTASGTTRFGFFYGDGEKVSLVTSGTAATTDVQVGIGTTTPVASALLEIKSSDKGILVPRTDLSTQAPASPKEGMLVYDTGEKCFKF